VGWSVGQLSNLSVGRCVVRFFSQSCRRSVVQALGIWLVDWLESWWVVNWLFVGLVGR